MTDYTGTGRREENTREPAPWAGAPPMMTLAEIRADIVQRKEILTERVVEAQRQLTIHQNACGCVETELFAHDRAVVAATAEAADANA